MFVRSIKKSAFHASMRHSFLIPLYNQMVLAISYMYSLIFFFIARASSMS